MIKDILVHVDNSAACESRLRAAETLANHHQAHLTALYVIPSPDIPVYAEAQLSAEVIEAQRQSAMDRAADARQFCENAMKGSEVAFEWILEEGNMISVLGSTARYFDLLILGQSQPEDPENVSHGLADNVLFDCGVPCLVVPYVGARNSIGKHVVVAWNAGRESARAVHDAIPIMEKADRVEVLSVDPDYNEVDEGDVPGVDIAKHLARHGVDVETHVSKEPEAGVGDIILSRASDMNADLIVMGAYGHSRLRETILGGVTKHILRDMTVPVLMSH